MGNEKLRKLRNDFSKEDIDAILVSSIHNILYLTGYSGFSHEEREAFVILTKEKQYILTDARYSHAIKNDVPDFELIETSSSLPLFMAVKNIIQKHKIGKLGIEENNLTGVEIRQILPFHNNLQQYTITNHRSVKTTDEIKKITAACALGDVAFEFILKKIKPGISEKEIAFELEYFIKKGGGDLSFPSIVAFGKNSAIPHHQTGNKKLGPSTGSGREGLFVLLDFGVKLNNYCSDMTRTVFFGTPTPEQRKMYETVLGAQKAAIKFLEEAKLPIEAKLVDEKAREYIRKRGFDPFAHGLGHGIGLQVHEAPSLSPNSKHLLQLHMVFSIEPGIYIPDYGGVRIEDLFVLEEKGIRQLTKSPKDIIVL